MVRQTQKYDILLKLTALEGLNVPTWGYDSKSKWVCGHVQISYSFFVCLFYCAEFTPKISASILDTGITYIQGYY
jgi:hypothetical protein